jgi:hypothetical protein
MAAVPERPWLQRNTKWIVLGAVALGLTLLALFVAAVAMLASAAMRTNDVYREALSRAQRHPALLERLGAPIEPGFFTSGSIDVSGPSGEADLTIPIHGPRGEATLNVVAQKRGGTWNYETMQVGDVDLLGAD